MPENMMHQGEHKSDQTDLTVIIVSYNSCTVLFHCIDSIFHFSEGLAIQIIVSDNASKDGTAVTLQQEYPSVTFIQNGENLGFAAANNRALAFAKGRYILFLNPDTLLFEAIFRKMIDFLDTHPDAGILGCTLLNPDETIQKSYFDTLPTLTNRFFEALYLEKFFDRHNYSLRVKERRQVAALVGACILISRTLAERLHGFDESFFMYCEDMDLSCRVRTLGYAVYYLGDIALYHIQGVCGRTKQSYFEKVMTKESVYCYFLKHSGQTKASIYKFSMAVASLFRLFVLFTWVPLSKMFGRRYDFHYRNSIRKYLHVLAWGCGLERWTKKAGHLPAITCTD
jgi:GT2 family glycosyltransferase